MLCLCKGSKAASNKVYKEKLTKKNVNQTPLVQMGNSVNVKVDPSAHGKQLPYIIKYSFYGHF